MININDTQVKRLAELKDSAHAPLTPEEEKEVRDLEGEQTSEEKAEAKKVAEANA